MKTQQLRQMNQHNGWLLEGQIERNQQALEMLKPHQEPTECIVTPSGGQIL